jgi:hypothetical protein
MFAVIGDMVTYGCDVVWYVCEVNVCCEAKAGRRRTDVMSKEDV